MERRCSQRQSRFRGTYSFRPNIGPLRPDVTNSFAGLPSRDSKMKYRMDHVRSDYGLESTAPALDLGESYRELYP